MRYSQSRNTDLPLEIRLYYAIKGRDHEVMVAILEDGFNPNELHQNGNTWAFCAAWNGNLEALKILRKYGADIATPGRDNHYFLIAGVMHHEILRYVLDTVDGINVNVSESRGITPLMQATHFERGENAEKPAKRIASVRLLVERGANINAQSVSGLSPLMGACLSRCPELISTMLELGADPGLVDSGGNTALYYLDARLQAEFAEKFSALSEEINEVPENL